MQWCIPHRGKQDCAICRDGGLESVMWNGLGQIDRVRDRDHVLMHICGIWKNDEPFVEKSYDQPRQCIKKQRHYFASKGPSSQSYGFSSSHAWM